MAPRFAALQRNQDPGDNMGPSGRPQLAPGFLFGATDAVPWHYYGLCRGTAEHGLRGEFCLLRPASSITFHH